MALLRYEGNGTSDDSCVAAGGIPSRETHITITCDETNVAGSFNYTREEPTCQYEYQISL